MGKSWKLIILVLVLGCAVITASERDQVNSNVEEGESSGRTLNVSPTEDNLGPLKEGFRKKSQLNSPNQWKPLKKSKYLAYLFRKYGSGGLITFEGLEHMMHNLGLGGLDFNPDHTIEEHHPEGYKIYDDDNDKVGGLDNRHVTEIRFKTTTDKPHNEVLEIKIHNRDDDESDEEIVVVKEVHSPTETSKEDEEVVYKSPDYNFKEMHDPKHRHPRFYDHHNGGMSCLSPSAMSKLLFQHKGYLYKVDRQRRHVSYYHYDDDDLDGMDVNDLAITPVEFIDILCPALLSQIERGDCVVKRKASLTDGITSEKKLFQFAWLYATISILIISMCGLIGVAIVPLTKSSSYDYILRFLVAVAIGTLAGDALMHLLPHALTPHLDHGDDTIADDNTGHKNDEPVFLCAFAFLAAVMMYVLETMLPLLYQLAGHNHSHHHHHAHSHAHNDHGHPRGRRSSSIIHEEMTLEPGHQFKATEGDVEPELNVSSLNPEEIIKKPKDNQLSPVAFMVIIGDGLHNITDGLAIGAAFAFDPITGMATALAVLCHELPHELGDFALLLKTGVSIKRALILNLISSGLSLVGMAFGLIVAGIHTSLVRWIYAATAGTFLYIAMADLIPEMGREPEGKTFKATLCQVTGILLGGLIMLTIALNEDRLRILFE